MQNTVEYWLNLCDEDISVAKILLDNHKYLQSGFFCHAVVEKSLKAVIANITTEVPSKIHKLKRLALIGDIFDILSEHQLSLLDELDPLQSEARYPEYIEDTVLNLNYAYCLNILKETEEFLCWIKTKLGR